MHKITAIGALLAVIALPGWAQQMYRCQNASGAFEYSDRPCVAATKEDVVKVKPNTLDASQERALDRRENLHKARDQYQSRPYQPQQGAASNDSYACRKARENFATSQSANDRNGNALADAQRQVASNCGASSVRR
jgi:hypothetical protein